MPVFRKDDRDDALDERADELEVPRSPGSPWRRPAMPGSNAAIAAQAAAARAVHRARRDDPAAETDEELEAEDDVEATAAAGLAGGRRKLPHGERIQSAFGDHDVSDVEAHTDDTASEASQALGAKGYAQGDAVAFDGEPDLHTAAHEAAHVVQNRAGDTSGAAAREHDADAVADKVVAGESAASLLPAASGATTKPADARAVRPKKGDDEYAWEKSILRKLRARKLPGSDASDLNWVLKKLMGDGSAQGKRLLKKLQRAARQSNYYLRKVSEIRSGAREVKHHKKGTDFGGSGTVTQRTCNTAIVHAGNAAPFANDPRLFELINECQQIVSFYNPVQTFGKDIEAHHVYVRQLTSALDAGALLDHHMLWSLRAPDGVSMWRTGVLEPYLGHPIVGNSKAFRRFTSCYEDFIALDARLKAMPNDGWDMTGRGLTKAELLARKKQAAPEFRRPENDDKDYDLSTVPGEMNRLEKRANELLRDSEPFPGDLYTTIQRLESIKPHVEPAWYARDRIDPLLKKLNSKLARSSDPEGVQKDSSQGVTVELDLDDAISIGRLKTALNTIANEPGEIGQVSFKITVRASYGNSVLKGFVEGWAQLRLFYGVSDAMSCFLGFDASAALGAGVSFADGLLEGKVEAGAGFGMKARFANPDHAAAWLWKQLKSINDYADEETGSRYRPFNLMGQAKATPSPTVVTEKSGFFGGEASADAGAVGGGVAGQKTWTESTFERDGKKVTGRTEESQITASGFVKVGPFLVTLAYTRTHAVTTGDINTTNDDDDMIHELSLELDLTKTIKEVSAGTIEIPEHLPRKRIFEILSKGLSKFGSKLPGGKVADKVIDKLVDGVAEKVFEIIEHGRKYKLGASVTMDIEFLSSKEGGSFVYKYTRAGVTPKFKASLEIDAKVIDVKAEFEASKREVVFESIGTDTSGYVFQRYVFAWDKAQWKEFVGAHEGDIKTLIRNMTRPRNNAYDRELAAKLKAAGYPKGSFEDHLAVVEKHWDGKKADTVRKEAR